MKKLSKDVLPFVFFLWFAIPSLLYVIFPPAHIFSTSTTTPNWNLHPDNTKWCVIKDHHELFSPNSDIKFRMPFFVLLYGKICNKLTLFLLNIPFFIVSSWLLAWTIRKITKK